MNFKRVIRPTLLVLILLIIKLYIGIYSDDEWGEKRLFIKYRPVWKTYFYSPRGLRDVKLSEMPIDKQKEQKMFDEFIIGKIVQ